MNHRLHPHMMEATRLTRAGQFGEATNFLQRLLRDKAAADSTSVFSGQTDRTPQPHLPTALRNMIERVNRIGSETGFPEPCAPDVVPDGAQFVPGSYSNQAGKRYLAEVADLVPRSRTAR